MNLPLSGKLIARTSDDAYLNRLLQQAWAKEAQRLEDAARRTTACTEEQQND